MKNEQPNIHETSHEYPIVLRGAASRDQRGILDHDIIVAKREGKDSGQPYVVWTQHIGDGITIKGSYCDTFDDAAEVFLKRLEINLNKE